MVRHASERVLLIGDVDRQVHNALSQSLPGARVTSVGNYFDGIAELAAGSYTAVLAAVEPVERRPEAAIKALRQLAGDGRVLLFGHPTLEPLAQKMLEFGCDDYFVTPASLTELNQIFGTPPLRLTTGEIDSAAGEAESSSGDAHATELSVTAPPTQVSLLAGLPLADLLLDALLEHPNEAPDAAIRLLNSQIAPMMQLLYRPRGGEPPAVPDGMIALSHPVRVNNEESAILHLLMSPEQEKPAARHALSQLAHSLGKIAALQDRHNRFQKLAITDDLTGVHNGRYFRHFLSRIIEKARVMRFPVTLFLFDIDNFKRYNDQFGHGVGDEILKQTAALMRRCCRDHDLVARISGDEFAVVFWEKEGPRQARDPNPGATSRLPQTPREILERFRRLLATQDFSGLGPGGQGVLTISGGLAVYPYDANDVGGLIDAADRALMFGAKQAGKNSIVLVGSEKETPLPKENQE